MKYPNVELGQVEAVWNMLGGVRGVEDLLSGRSVILQLKPELFPVWTTVNESWLKTNEDDIWQSFREMQIDTNADLEEMMLRIHQSRRLGMDEKHKVYPLVTVSGALLGFNRQCNYYELIARAQRAGLELCPKRLGCALRRFRPVMSDDIINIGMDPIPMGNGYHCIFQLTKNTQTLGIYGKKVSSLKTVKPDIKFVFVRPPKRT